MRSRMPSPVPALLFLSFFLTLGALAAWSQSPPASFTLTAKVRDFKELNPTDSVKVDSQFNNYNGCSAQELGVNTIQENLDTSGAVDAAFPGDNRNPMLMDPLPASIAPCYDPVARFPEWFSDKGPDINRAFLVDLRFDRDASGLYTYKSDAFFPIDSGKAFRKIHTTDPDPFGQLQKDSLDGKDLSQHNYGFTLELHTQVAYHAGEVLRFQGDDDIWVFINGKRVIDLGGVHQTQKDSVIMDSVKTRLGLEDGKTYPLDFFFAERHVASSSVLITTNVAPVTPINRPVAFHRAAPEGPVSIYDRMGRLVRALPQASAWAAGASIPAWDRRDEAGRIAAPGVYLWRAVDAAPGQAGILVVR
ncbi:MAG: fibro-slime domain-containing protein [Fibrobacteres bacterium]|jgi:fibro-slime domain-containing protein|nr:fibro-slime domain-containing protein [Fibrobacterota bacterium]